MTRRSARASGKVSTRVLILGGPTGAGKNCLALEFAARQPSEIINADSRQVYRELVIGTNQPSPDELRAVPHHLYGWVDPGVEFTAADYERAAFPLIEEITGRGKLAIVVGGTGFYIRALLKGTWEVPARNPELRLRLREIGKRKGTGHLHNLLARFDPASARTVQPNDVYRVIRSIEICLQSGKRRSELARPRPDRFSATRLFVNPDRAQLHKNIEARTERMFRAGWVEEVRALLEKYPDFDRMPASRSLGYPEIIASLRGEISLAECKTRIIVKTNQYAKRQLTWFRNQDGFLPLAAP